MTDIHAFRGKCTLSENGRPVIHVGADTVPEPRRLQAALNMRLVPQIKARIVEMLGEAESKLRYPEAFCSEEELDRMHPGLYQEKEPE